MNPRRFERVTMAGVFCLAVVLATTVSRPARAGTAKFTFGLDVMLSVPGPDELHAIGVGFGPLLHLSVGVSRNFELISQLGFIPYLKNSPPRWGELPWLVGAKVFPWSHSPFYISTELGLVDTFASNGDKLKQNKAFYAMTFGIGLQLGRWDLRLGAYLPHVSEAKNTSTFMFSIGLDCVRKEFEEPQPEPQPEPSYFEPTPVPIPEPEYIEKTVHKTYLLSGDTLASNGQMLVHVEHGGIRLTVRFIDGRDCSGQTTLVGTSDQPSQPVSACAADPLTRTTYLVWIELQNDLQHVLLPARSSLVLRLPNGDPVPVGGASVLLAHWDEQGLLAKKTGRLLVRGRSGRYSNDASYVKLISIPNSIYAPLNSLRPLDLTTPILPGERRRGYVVVDIPDRIHDDVPLTIGLYDVEVAADQAANPTKRVAFVIPIQRQPWQIDAQISYQVRVRRNAGIGSVKPKNATASNVDHRLSPELKGSGILVDHNTGLMWQGKTSDKLMNWQEAMDYCISFDYGGVTDWRLPTISELRSLIRGCAATVTSGSCKVTDACLNASCQDNSCHGCKKGKGPGPQGAYWTDGLQDSSNLYWSSSSIVDYSTYAASVNFADGSIFYRGKGFYNAVRCVRKKW